jgi:dTDP-4-amino-4,6-dideoxygalactose transaminase
VSGPGAYCFGEEERREVLDVLSSGHLSRYGALDDPGFKHKVYSLEQEFARFCGVGHAIGTSSGTGSLLLSLLALGVGEGDEVLVPGFTYVASIGAIVHAGAIPVLVEIDDTLNIDPQDIRRKITPRTKAILVVHMLGNPADMGPILGIADEHAIPVVEDVCQAAGGSYRGRRLGSFGAFGAFSLNRYKMMCAGDGGLIATDDEALYKRAFALHDQGHSPLRTTKEMPAHAVVGLNFKMNELTGAVALAQLRKLDRMLATLRAKKAELRGRIPAMDGVAYRRVPDPDGECATLLTVIFDDPARAAAVAACLNSRTVGQSGWHVYTFMTQIRAHARCAEPGDLPATDAVLSRAVNISIGVVDNGIGAGFGININSTREQIAGAANTFVAACRAA